MNVFVTGHRGYVGAHLVDLLKLAGHHVTGCDLNLFDGCAWEQLVQPDCEMVRDVRMLTPRDLEGFDCVMHLAAISNDPMGDLDPEITRDINARGSITLARAAKAAAVPRFFFSSSCSIYGKADGRPLAEEDALNPVSVYAEFEDCRRGGHCRARRLQFLAGLSAQCHGLRRLADAAHRPRGQQPIGLRGRQGRHPHHE